MPPTEKTVALDTVYARVPDIVPRQIAGDTILVAVRGKLARLERLHVLNAVGEHIWGLLDGRRTVAEICDDVSENFDVDVATAHKDVAEFLDDLEDAGLVTRESAVP
jgi:hypothetical protein